MLHVPVLQQVQSCLAVYVKQGLCSGQFAHMTVVMWDTVCLLVSLTAWAPDTLPAASVWCATHRVACLLAGSWLLHVFSAKINDLQRVNQAGWFCF